MLALKLDNLRNLKLLVFLEPGLKLVEVNVAFVSFELFPGEGALVKRLVCLAQMALNSDLTALSFQMGDDLGVCHGELVIFALAEASVLPRLALSMRVHVLIHFILRENIEWPIIGTLVSKEYKFVQNHQKDLVFDWAKAARATRDTLVG